MSTCAQLDDYVAGRLSNGDTAAFETHAATCENCGKAVARKKAVERAAKVLRRNEVTRGPSTPAAPLSLADQPTGKMPAAAPTRPLPALTPDYDRPTVSSRRPLHLVVAGGVGLVVLVGGLLVFWSKGSEAEPVAPTAVAEMPAHPEPEPLPIEAPPAELPPPELTAPPPAPKSVAPEPTPSPAPAVTAPVATPTKAATPVDPKLEFYPVGTDYELLAETIAGKKCGMAVSALRARVQKDPSEARTWSLLAQCYVKRKRWKNAIEAYDMVVKYGDQAMVDALAGPVEKARAGVQAETDAAKAPADAATPTPPPVE